MRSSAFLVSAVGLCAVFSVACGGGGKSYTPCTADGDCEAGEICLQAECQPAPSCTEDEDCTGGRVCLEGLCAAAECNEDGDCPADQHCQDHRCEDGAPCNCSTDADCAADEFCLDECSCEPREQQPCQADDECSAGELCIDQVCTLAPTCSADADCPTGTVCEDGHCARPCAADADCGNEQLNACLDGHCYQRCLQDNNCQGGQICDANICVDAQCATDADCEGELIRCHNGRCEEYTPCASDADCDPNYMCLDDICEERPTCSIDQDCWRDGLANYFCEDGHCRPAPTCQSEADCDADRDCVAGLCVPFVCRGLADCDAGQLCVAGVCQDPDPGATVYEVIILNPGGPIHQGQPIQLMAIALTQAGVEVPGAELSWASSNPDAVTVDAAGLATGGDTAGLAEISATAVAADVDSDPVAFTNVLDVSADTLRVNVVEALGRAPVAGAEVMVVSGGNTETATTDADGVASFSLPADPADVHVFAADHNYVSIIATSAADLLVPLPELSDRTEVGGYTGQMTFEGIGELSMGVAGASLAGNLVDLDFARLMGQVFNVNIPQVGSIPLPAQMVAELSFMGQTFPLKDTYYVAGQAGLRSAWALGGRVSSDVLWELTGGGINIEDVLVGLLPYFSLLNHSLQPVVDVFPTPLVVDANDIDADGDTVEMRPDWESMLDLDMAPQVPQNLAVEVTVPALPTHAGLPMLTAIYVSGGLTPLGFTPLGMSAARDESGQLPPLVMKMAPAYGGLQVGAYGVLVLGFPQTAQDEMATDMAAVLHVADTLPTDVSFEQDFLGFPEDADWSDQTRSMAATGVAGADLYRSTFQAEGGGWEVYVPAGDPVNYSLPAPPDGMPDLTAGATVTLDPISLGAGLTYDDLVSFNGEDLDGINFLAVAFSRFQLP